MESYKLKEFMHKVFLGIGGNLGNKNENFGKVIRLIEDKLGKVVQASSIYETPPWGFHAEDNFWNQVLLVETEQSPQEILDNIHTIESNFGRERKAERYNSREMDIDILYYDDDFLESETLIIPHPHISKRLFVLVPLAEIAPAFKHPLFRLTSIQMLENCKDKSVIKKI
ncbi:MAG: 2-amino-4-hydroxy-6-hydroxymethyldihydropteridine diphosphokinase [Prolixibacteraceae bacterium]|nr:2-amino-4-hydroxy-6-hydroxymethyldihydropteridine diphosphokinase [Prolixibacteraceae bacterium]